MASGTTGRMGWYHGWNIVAVAVLAQIAANGLAINSMSLFLGGWAKDLHSPISQLLIAIVPLAFVAAVASPVVGTLVDKYPARPLFGAGLAGIALFCLGISFVNATWQIWVLYGAIFPVSLCLCTSITANAVVSRWFVRRLGVALGITAFGVGIAGAILPPVIAWVMPVIGWRLLWRFAGIIIGLIVLPLVVWVVRDKPSERDGTYYLTGGSGTHVHHGHGASASNLGWMDILKRRNFWLIVICFLPMLSLFGGVQQNIAPIATSYGLKQETAGLLLAIFSMTGVAAMLMTGFLSDRYGNRLPLAGLTALSAAGGLIIGYGHGFVALAVGVGLVGVANGMWTLLPAAMALEFGASGVGRAFGALMLFLPINSFAPSLIAKVQENTGSYGPAMLGLAAITLLGGTLVLLMREKHGGHATPEEREAALEEVPNPIP